MRIYPLLSLSSVFALVSVVSATDPTVHLTESRRCQDYSIPVNVTASVLTAAYPTFSTDFDAAGWLAQLTRRDSRTAFQPFSGSKNVTASFNIAGTICSPLKKTDQAKTLILATHGLGFDRRYWDAQMNPTEYSFVDFAISRGYSVFFYDRLGTGLSTKVSGYETAQAGIQVAILARLSTLLRSGQYTGGLGKPSKLVHIGHSFGSALSNGLISTAPEVSDGVILTGLGFDMSGFALPIAIMNPRIANAHYVGRWPGLDNHYLAPVDIISNFAFFFHGDSVDKQLLWYSDSVSQPLATAELLTIATVIGPAPKFTGPAMVISGEFDVAVCGGNCTGTLQGPASLLYSKAKDLQTVVVPKMGHAINYSYNATGAYGVMIDYLHSHDL